MVKINYCKFLLFSALVTGLETLIGEIIFLHLSVSYEYMFSNVALHLGLLLDVAFSYSNLALFRNQELNFANSPPAD